MRLIQTLIDEHDRDDVVTIDLVSLVVTAGGVVSTHVTSERTANIAVEQTLAQEEYEELELVLVRLTFSAEPFFPDPQEIIVTVRAPADQEYPGLSEQIRERIVATSDREPIVAVNIVGSQQSPAEGSDELPSERVVGPTSVGPTVFSGAVS